MPRLQFLANLILCMILCSCHEPGNPEGTGNDPVEARANLIDALKDMEHRISSRDTTQIAPLFKFPIPDSVMSFYLEDSIYQKWHAKHHWMPREAFDTLFPKLQQAWDLDMFKDFFRHIDFDKLTIHNSLKRQLSLPEDYCNSEFDIRIQGDTLVNIFYGCSRNPDYAPYGDKPDPHTPDECKHEISWAMHWDEKKLTVIRQTVVN